jgi:hypothetical protein
MLIVVGAAGIAVWLVLGLSHLGDRYKIGHVQGHWMALAKYAHDGTLYPPLSDGVRFGGTRHMPLPILLNAAASGVTGEYLRSGKAVAMLLFTALLLLLFLALRQVHCPRSLGIALAGLLPSTNTGVLVGCSVGGDVLPAVFQVASLLTFTTAVQRGTVGWMIVSGMLAGVAAASKLTGVWAALAIVSWLTMRGDWRRIAWFLGASVATAVVAFGIVQWASEGRFLTTFSTLTFAGKDSPVGWMRAPSQLTFFGSGDALAVWMIAPFAILGMLVAWRSSALTVYHHALAWSLVLTLIVFTDIGAGLNQLLDPAVLVVVVVGIAASNASLGRLGATSLATALALTVMWAGTTGIRGFIPDLRDVDAAVRSGETLPKYTATPLAGTIAHGETLLTEDPGLPVLLGQTPVVLDAFMLRRLAQVQPRTIDGLISRIERGEFEYLALIMPLSDEDFWWHYYHFGPRIIAALRRTYVLVSQVDGYNVYRPRRR